MISEPSTFIESFHLIRERVWERAKFGNWKIGIPDSNHHGRLYNRQETDFLEVTIQTPAVQVGVKFLLWHLGMTTSRGLVEGMMAKTVEDHAHYVLSALLDAGKLGIKKKRIILASNWPQSESPALPTISGFGNHYLGTKNSPRRLLCGKVGIADVVRVAPLF